MAQRGLALLGCGGHARSVADVALIAGFERLLFIDREAKAGEELFGFPVQSFFPNDATDWLYLPCAGDNRARGKQIEDVKEAGLELASVVSPHTSLGRDSVIGAGCFVANHVHVGPRAVIGSGSILNTGAVVEHDCEVGESSHVSVRAVVAGSSKIGRRVFLGAGSVVIDKVEVADDVVIGAGGVVVESIKISGTYVGVPVTRLMSAGQG